MKSRALPLCLFAVMASACCASADWTHFQGPDLDGISPEKDLSCGAMNTLWEANVHTGFSGITVSDGRVFTMGHQNGKDYVIALSEKDGTELWRYAYPQELDPNLYEGGPNATPTIDCDLLYTISKQGKILCLNVKTGDVVWKTDASAFNSDAPRWGFASAPTVLGNAVLFNAGTAGLALQKTNGKKIWASGGAPAGYAPLIPYKNKGTLSVMLVSGKEIVSVAAASGAKQWSLPFKVNYDVNAVPPLFAGQRAFVSAGYDKGGGVYDFSSGKGKEVWFNRSLKTQFSAAVIIDGYVYGLDGSAKKRSKLVCLDLKDGSLKWREPYKFGNVRYADGKLFVLEEHGQLSVVSVSPSGKKDITSKKILGGRCWTAPTITNGKLFARNAEGAFVCINLK